MALERGAVIDGKYEILKQIGKGGMSVVYLAMDLRLNKQWAIKVIQRSGIGKNNEVVLNKVPDDTELMKKLDHPAIPRIVDIIDRKDDPQIYIVMDYVEGDPLDKVVEEYGAQSEEIVIDWAKQICDTLNYLHNQKPPIIYRDMKPANLMLKPEGNLKIIDFGISREYKEQNLADTTVLGTKGYAPPEQFGSRQTDARSDIYALGMTLYHLVTGVDPRKNDYVPIRQWNPQLSEGLEYIINKCVQMSPEDRYQNCNELMYDLEHYELIGLDYKRKQKNKLGLFFASVAMTVVMLIAGLAGMVVKHATDSKNYDKYITYIDNSVNEQEAAKNCFLAIELDPTRPEAYQRYIDKSTDFRKFLSYTVENSKDADNSRTTYDINTFKQEFLNPDNSSKLAASSDYDKLCYEAGYIIFNLYGDDSTSKREAALAAKEFFAKVSETSEYYGVAQSFSQICEFYGNFVNNANGNQASKADCEQLVNNITKFLEDDTLDNGKLFEHNREYVELTLFYQFENLLNDYRKAFANNGIDKSSVESIFDRISKKADETVTTNDVNTELRDKVIVQSETYKANLNRAYENTAKAKTGSQSAEGGQ